VHHGQPNDAWKKLEVSRYAERWPLIAATGELEISSVTVRALDHKNKKPRRFRQYQVLLHKQQEKPAFTCVQIARRLSEAQNHGFANVRLQTTFG